MVDPVLGPGVVSLSRDAPVLALVFVTLELDVGAGGGVGISLDEVPFTLELLLPPDASMFMFAKVALVLQMASNELLIVYTSQSESKREEYRS